MKNCVMGLGALGLALISTSAFAAQGLNQSVYYNTSASGTPAYTFLNSHDGFQYQIANDGSISAFLGSDAAGPATTDSTPVSNISMTASGYIDVLTPGNYTFTLGADDYGSVSVDGSQLGSVVWQNGTQTFADNLTVGYHPFELSYIADGTPNWLSYSLADPNGGTSGFQYTTTNAVSAAPEPSTWALMIAGIGLMGGTLRLRRKGLAGA